MYQIEFSSKAYNFISKADKELKKRIIKKIEQLKEIPCPQDSKKIVNKNGKIYRVRVGNYRILYEILNDELIIIIINVDKRSRVYKKRH